MSLWTDNNISVESNNQISKYNDFKIETKEMWYVKTITVAVKTNTQNNIYNIFYDTFI